jgi:type 1 glutamine amidotransferase
MGCVMHRWVTRFALTCLAFLTIAALLRAAVAASADGAAPVNVLIVTGQNNHDWEETTPQLQQILEKSKGFKVRVTKSPQKLTAAKLDGVDVILSNWNTYGGGVKQWPDAAKSAYVQFVNAGGGHVVVHAGSSSFYDWEAYHKISLATWKGGQTTHGAPHTFKVRHKDVDHPIVDGLKMFETRDELWRKPGVHPDARVLGSAYSQNAEAWVPTTFVGRFGEGRSFTTLLGHNAQFMRNAGFKRLLRRGTAWAALGEVPAWAKQVDQPGHE